MRIDYAAAGVFTSIDAGLVTGLPADPVGVCAAVSTLVIHPFDAERLALGERRMSTSSLRPVARILAELLALDPAPPSAPRAPADRVVGTCRHFATVSVAFLRALGTAARARCGFASYFQPGRHVDHWVVEHHDGIRWRRVDPEVLDSDKVRDPTDLGPDEFRSGGEAWQLVQAGGADPMTFGVPRTDDAWGPAEIRGNAIRDLAALMKIETLPWDEWGRMTDSYRGDTGPDFDDLIDEVSIACAADDVAVVECYRNPELMVPSALTGTA